MKYIVLVLILLSGGYLAFATNAKDNVSEAIAETPVISEQIAITTTQADDVEVPAAVQEGVNALKTFLKEKESTPVSIAPSNISGLYEVVLGSQILYLGDDGKHFVAGNMLRMNTSNGAIDNVTNITEKRLAAILNPLRKSMIDEINEKDMVVFAPEGETKYTVNVFTDVKCGYCAKFHQQMESLNKAGIKVRYLAFPRAGIPSKTYDIMQSVWCSDDRQIAMTKAKAREEIEEKTCNNPIESQYNLGQKMGVNGTPALLLSNGELIPGYLPTEQLVLMLQHKDL